MAIFKEKHILEYILASVYVQHNRQLQLNFAKILLSSYWSRSLSDAWIGYLCFWGSNWVAWIPQWQSGRGPPDTRTRAKDLLHRRGHRLGGRISVHLWDTDCLGISGPRIDLPASALRLRSGAPGKYLSPSTNALVLQWIFCGRFSWTWR